MALVFALLGLKLGDDDGHILNVDACRGVVGEGVFEKIGVVAIRVIFSRMGTPTLPTVLGQKSKSFHPQSSGYAVLRLR